MAIACTIPTSSLNPPAWADGFKRIRTFDPNKGLVAGNGAGIPITPQTYSPPSTWSTQQATGQSVPPARAPGSDGSSSMVTRDYGQQTPAKQVSSASDEDSEDSRDSKHHKHHHKFLIFGHGGSEGQSGDNAPHSDQANTRMSVDRAPDIQQNNKLYIPISPTYTNTDPLNTAVSTPVPSQRMPSSVVPPDPRQRPSTPNIDQNARLPIVQNSGAKPSLAWRARAWKLASELDDASSAGRHPCKILNCSTDEALSAAATCCRAKGAQIVGQSLPAGQLGVRFNDGSNNRSFIVFVAKSIGNNRTLLKASADSDRAQKVSLANDLIQQVGVIIDGKGLL